jgi:hypothetical protein
MAHYPPVNSPDFKARPFVRVTDHNPRVFRLGELTDAECLHLVNRMQAGAPGLYNMLHTDPFVKTLITDFDADIVIPKREK